jgi:hypothetical protein
MVLIARTLPKWCSAIGIVPATEAGIGETLDRLPYPVGYGDICESELECLSDSNFPSLKSLWFGNTTLNCGELYSILSRHSYTLKEVTFCNVRIDTSRSDGSGILCQVIYLIHWLRRECNLEHVRFYGRIRDQYGTAIVCSRTNNAPPQPRLICSIEEYISGEGAIADFPFESMRPHRYNLLLGDVYSVGARLYRGSKWRRDEIPLEEDQTWYAEDPAWFCLIWSLIVMVTTDILRRWHLTLKYTKGLLHPWIPSIMRVVFFTLGLAAFWAAFSLGMVWARQEEFAEVQDFADDIRYICSKGLLRETGMFGEWENDYINDLCAHARGWD